MDGGVVLESGPPEDFLTNPAHPRAMSFLRLVSHDVAGAGWEHAG
jgi:L-cystine transport system ATP-binding protein